MYRSSTLTWFRSSSYAGKRWLSQLQTSRKGKQFLQVSEEIKNAVALGKPVVALETTIYTHGIQNLVKMTSCA